MNSISLPYSHQHLRGRHILLGLSGGIACYKAAHLCRLLRQAGASVQVVMTEAAQQFITPVTMQALSGRPVVLSQWDARTADHMPHIHLAREADAILIAPCSADFAAQLAQGRAHELLSLLCLARPRERAPLLLAPAMNREMWSHPATQRNFAQAGADGAQVLQVGCGEQACGETGEGRMPEPEDITEALAIALAPRLLAGRHVLITAGPTFEAIDPVRGITNLSSGKMGFAIAAAARAAGARVTLVAGPVALPTPQGVHRINVQSARDMLHAVQSALGEDGTTTARAPDALLPDVFIATAAVADWRPERTSARKIKKDPANPSPPQLSMEENPDILATVARSARAASGALYCVGFAAESHDLLPNATVKRQRKGVPLLVANIGPAAFGLDDNALVLVDEHSHRELARAPKSALAWQLVQELASRLAPQPQDGPRN